MMEGEELTSSKQKILQARKPDSVLAIIYLG